MKDILQIMLWIHIAGGTLSLITGLGAMLTSKGGTVHRRFGKTYFWSMTIVFISAVVLAIGHQRTFLFMIAFFSYYFTVRGYRILFLKNLGMSTKPKGLDWFILIVSSCFMLFLISWGAYTFINGDTMGVVGLVFGTIGTTFVVRDVQQFHKRPEHMHWWYGHISSMGASYIAASTAFIVVNISIPGFGWALWIFPSVVGGMLIGRTVRKYKVKFASAKS
jgi:hypothetical protein